jgi:hypothetical protein
MKLFNHVLELDFRARRRLRSWLIKQKKRLTALDYSKIEDIEIDGINTRDYPDFCDAYISSATYKGREMTESELDRLNEDSDFVYEQVLERIY